MAGTIARLAPRPRVRAGRGRSLWTTKNTPSPRASTPSSSTANLNVACVQTSTLSPLARNSATALIRPLVSSSLPLPGPKAATGGGEAGVDWPKAALANRLEAIQNIEANGLCLFVIGQESTVAFAT